MPIVSLYNLGEVGISDDIPAHELPPEAWTSGRNVRFLNGKVVKFQGHSQVYGTPSVVPYHILPVPGAATHYWLYAGLAKVYATTGNGSVHSNITRQTVGVDVDYAALASSKWNSCMFNGIPLINNGIDLPQIWLPVSIAQRLVALTNWPATKTCAVMRPLGPYLVAIDITTSGTRNPYLVKWSHPADPGTVPSSWDETDTTKDAGEYPLAETGGFALDLHEIGNLRAIIYKEDCAYEMAFVGGTEIFRFRKFPGELNILARECVKPVRGFHFLVTTDDIVLFDGQQIKSLLSRKRRSWLFNSLDSSNRGRSFVVANYAKAEMWFCFTSAGAVQPDKALIWNWETNSIGDRDLPTVAHAMHGFVDNSTVDTSWNIDLDSWDTDSTLWGNRAYNPLNTSILMASSLNTKLYLGDNSNQFAGSNMSAFVERIGLSIVGRDRTGVPKSDQTTIKYVRRIIPRIKKSSGTMNIYIGTQMLRDEAVTWSAPYAFNPSVDYEVQTDAYGRFIAVRFESVDNSDWEMDAYDLDLELAGQY